MCVCVNHACQLGFFLPENGTTRTRTDLRWTREPTTTHKDMSILLAQRTKAQYVFGHIARRPATYFPAKLNTTRILTTRSYVEPSKCVGVRASVDQGFKLNIHPDIEHDLHPHDIARSHGHTPMNVCEYKSRNCPPHPPPTPTTKTNDNDNFPLQISTTRTRATATATATPSTVRATTRKVKLNIAASAKYPVKRWERFR